jgi:hypothetical protein
VRLEHGREVEVDDRVGREHERRPGDVPVVHHPQRRVRTAGRQHVVLDRRVLHVDAEPFAVPDHDLDLIAVLFAVRDHVVVLDPLAREDLDHPTDQAPAEEGHRGLGAQVAGRLEGERPGADPLPARQADADDLRHLRHRPA